MQIGRLSINLNERIAQVGDTPLNLSGREYQVLEMLALRKGATVSREALLNDIYGGLNEPDPKFIVVCICKIRRKLADALGAEVQIETVWGCGYKLTVSALPAAHAAA